MQPSDPSRSLEQSGDDADVEITAPSGTEDQPPVPEAEVEVLAAGTTAGRYMVLERVGSGGMGVVYAAFDHELDRKVALKVMHARADGAQTTGNRERLQREAQAMAKLSHPNVITVHDVGTFEDRVFIAMEFIDGPTLRAWMAQGPHELVEIVDVFVKAGRGLAAAHAAGLVHRDFKPDNVLIGRDGRVLVMDFGLARQASARPLDALPTPEARGKGLHDLALTRTGALVGTPAYMAPEQHRGATADPLVDQFGFCVALYEALYGQRPFAGNSVASIAINVLEGHVRSPPRGTAVPAWLRAVVVRGLAVDPLDRYPSMDALLAELQADPPESHRPWRAGAIVLGMGAMLATTYLVARAFEDDPCELEADRLGQSWDTARRDAVRTAFSATGLPFADTSGQTTIRMLDAWSERWSEQRVAQCHAAPPSSSTPLAARAPIRCLDGQRHELDALIDRLEHADPITVTQAVAAAAALPDPARCEAAEPVIGPGDPPSDEPPQLEQLRDAAAQARVLLHTGAPLEAARIAEPLVKSAAAAEDPGLEAEAGLVLAQALTAQDQPARAEEQLHAAVVRAAIAGRPALEAEVWLELVHVVGERLGLHDEAYLAAVAGEAAIARARLRVTLGPRLEAVEAAVALDQGRYEDAHEHLERARERLRSLDPMPELAVADAWQDFGTALDGLGRFEEALRAYTEALRLHEQLLGAQHPRVGASLARLGGAMLGAGLLLQAEATFVRARWLLDPAHVTDEPLADDDLHAVRLAEPQAARLAELPRWQLRELAAVLDRQGLLERDREEPGAAEALHRHALALLEGSLDPRHRDLGYPLVNLGLSLTEQGQPRDALAYLQRAHEIWTAELDPQHPDLGLVSLDLANALWALDDYTEARRRYADALAIWQAVLPEDHPLLAYPLTGLGRCDLALGARAAALESLERAYELRDEDEDRLNVAETSLLLARALWAAGTDPTRARALVVQARELAGAAEPVDEAGLQRVLAGQEYSRFTDQLVPAGLGATNRDTRGGR